MTFLLQTAQNSVMYWMVHSTDMGLRE